MTLMALLDNPKLLLKAPATTTPSINNIKTTNLRTVLMTIHKLSTHHITRNRQAAHAGCLLFKGGSDHSLIDFPALVGELVSTRAEDRFHRRQGSILLQTTEAFGRSRINNRLRQNRRTPMMAISWIAATPGGKKMSTNSTSPKIMSPNLIPAHASRDQPVLTEWKVTLLLDDRLQGRTIIHASR
ncbi:MAG: hypothetical protein ACR2RF_31050 [Geminicoccaceae bacterium]